MKILLYSDCFTFGGSENVIENLLKSDVLNKNNQFVFFYAYNKRYKEAVDKKFSGFQNIHPVTILSAFSKWGYDVKLSKKAFSVYSLYIKICYFISLLLEKASLYDVYNYMKLYKTFVQQMPDVLYINNGGYPGARSCRIAAFSAKRAGINTIIFNVNNLALPQKGIVDKWLDKKINISVKIFITASKAAKNSLIRQRNFDAAKCVDIPNTILQDKEICASSIKPVLREEFKIKKDELIIGSAGLLTNRKGFLILIEAIGILISKKKLHFKVFIFGEGEQRMILENKIKEYKLENYIALPGYRNDISEYIKDFDVFVCPSIGNEDFPYVILEAMMLGKPIIGTNIAGIPEQVADGYNGFIVPANAAAKIADKIEILFSDNELKSLMGKNSFKRYSENFNNNHVMQCYNKLFRSLQKA